MGLKSYIAIAISAGCGPAEVEHNEDELAEAISASTRFFDLLRLRLDFDLTSWIPAVAVESAARAESIEESPDSWSTSAFNSSGFCLSGRKRKGDLENRKINPSVLLSLYC